MESDASVAFFLLFSSLLYYLLPPFLKIANVLHPPFKILSFFFPFILFSHRFQSRKVLEIDQNFCSVSQEIHQYVGGGGKTVVL